MAVYPIWLKFQNGVPVNYEMSNHYTEYYHYVMAKREIITTPINMNKRALD